MNKYIKFKGLNLTIETLDGLLKHNGSINDSSFIETIIGINNFSLNFTLKSTNNSKEIKILTFF